MASIQGFIWGAAILMTWAVSEYRWHSHPFAIIPAPEWTNVLALIAA
jgi:hypothetical protein